MLKSLKGTGWRGFLPLVIIFAGITIYLRQRSKSKMAAARAGIGPAEAQVIATKLTGGGLSEIEQKRLTTKLSDNGYKVAGGKAVRV